ncbi:hypothetical protein DUI87_20706 [Hirundo rustica rustica]|uniref:Retroviral nucleocapsid Gag protein p24 C-terminal domain-containing protein n=1 Tax=Hirundo rustica rustica TaxID=333673 RepID=A0A3M0K8P3_HIRRU|nr:hypothetical protein DUI87_20706 [Hirundo rustica rustica]
MEKPLRYLLPELWQNPETAVDNNNLPILLEHLCGDGEWVSALKQAQEIPLAVLEHIKDAAFKAFFSIQPDGPIQPYRKIKQLPSEPFVTFVERLTRPIELQVKNEGAQEQVLEEMALTNANEHCKAAILSLPLEPVPTLDDMLHVCTKKCSLHDGSPKPQFQRCIQATAKSSRRHAPCVCATATAQDKNEMSPVRSGWALGLSMPFKEAISGFSG